MTTTDVLRHMRARLSEPGKWTKGGYARDKQGRLTRSNSKDAVCFCMLGAMRTARDAGNQQNAANVLLSVLAPLGYGSIPSFNDSPTTTHADVLSVLDKAIEQAS